MKKSLITVRSICTPTPSKPFCNQEKVKLFNNIADACSKSQEPRKGTQNWSKQSADRFAHTHPSTAFLWMIG